MRPTGKNTTDEPFHSNYASACLILTVLDIEADHVDMMMMMMGDKYVFCYCPPKHILI